MKAMGFRLLARASTNPTQLLDYFRMSGRWATGAGAGASPTLTLNSASTSIDLPVFHARGPRASNHRHVTPPGPADLLSL